MYCEIQSGGKPDTVDAESRIGFNYSGNVNCVLDKSKHMHGFLTDKMLFGKSTPILQEQCS